MFDAFLDKMTLWLDDATDFIWHLFQKDLEMTEAILARTESVWDRIAVMINGRQGR
jgi:hypothetical protein